MITRTYLIENLDCAHCGAKIERQLNKLDGIEATLTFATMQLRITAEDPDALFDTVVQTATKIEPDIKLTLRDKSRRSSHKPAEEHHHHEHEDHCDCGCEHDHEHEHHHH